MNSDHLANLRDAVRYLLNCDPESSVEAQALYQAARDWALRGMGYGIGDHPATSGERGVLEVLAQRTPNYAVIFDVGANVGAWADQVLARFDRCELHCFEPSREAFLRLSTMTRMERLSSWSNFGLSDAERTAPLHTDTLGSGMASVYPRNLAHFGRSLGVEERATFRRLDDVCREIGVTRIDLLKLDVEGHELAVLRGAGDMLTSGAIGMIQFEMGGCNLDSHTTWQDFWYLLSPHYDLFRVVSDGLVRIPSYREQDEVYICANFVAMWRDHG